MNSLFYHEIVTSLNENYSNNKFLLWEMLTVINGLEVKSEKKRVIIL